MTGTARTTRTTRLFHFSDDGSFELFEPRPVRTPAKRVPGREWLNGPLVWAIDEWHQPMYLFPRECPRILFWALGSTTDEDRRRYLDSNARIIAHIEKRWLPALERAVLWRYEFSPKSFESLDDAGMWVSRTRVAPLAKAEFGDLPARLAEQGVELRVLDTLTSLRGMWDTSLHASGIRLRNAQGW